MTRWAPLDGFGKATAPSAADAGAPGCVGANVTRLVDTKGGRDPTGRRCGTASRLAWCSSVIQRYEPTREGATHSINRSPLTGGLHTDKGACDPAGEAAQIAMEHQLPLAVVCRLLDAPRSTIYARRRTGGESGRRGPMPAIGDQELVGLIRRVLADSPFAGESYRKVRARLRRQHGVRVSGKRVLRLLRREGLLAPQVVDHYTAEAWAHVAKVGDRFAALQPVYDAVIDRFGGLTADVARGLSLRHDWGPQYRSDGSATAPRGRPTRTPPRQL